MCATKLIQTINSGISYTGVNCGVTSTNLLSRLHPKIDILEQKVATVLRSGTLSTATRRMFVDGKSMRVLLQAGFRRNLRVYKKMVMMAMMFIGMFVFFGMPISYTSMENRSRLEKTIEACSRGLENYRINPKEENLWKYYCNGKVDVINSQITLMHGATIDGNFIESSRYGGESLSKVMGQSEESEQVTLQKGFIQLPCKSIPILQVSDAYEYLQDAIDIKSSVNSDDSVNHFTVVTRRKDYANLYWTIIELYNTYLTIKLFKQDPKSAYVILLDAHPEGKLDHLWNLVFGTVLRVRTLTGEMFKFKHLSFGIDTFGGPITLGLKQLPYMSHLRDTLYEASGLPVPAPSSCVKGNRRLNITLILRRDYVAHARNPSGRLKRKLKNEQDIIDSMVKQLPMTKVRAVQLDSYNVTQQIQLIYHTDILVGVHGAGLGYSMFMRPGTGMIELFPTSYRIFKNNHFKEFADWANLKYSSWYKFDPLFRDSEWLYVPTSTMVSLVQSMIDDICGDT